MNSYVEALSLVSNEEPDLSALDTVEGVLQHMNYRTGEFKIIALGRVFVFKVERDCRLFFDGKDAILRTFHALDRVRVVFEPAPQYHRARALYAWEKV